MIENPYPGLRSFTQDEASLFFGREVQARQLRDILADRNLLVVLGGSGSGKSSLVRAGLLPKLNSTAPIPKRSGAWYPIEFRPRTNPSEELFEAIFSQLFQPLLKALPAPVATAMEPGPQVQPPTAVDTERLRRLEAVSATLKISPALQVDENVEVRCKEKLRELLFSDQIFDIGSLFEFAEQSIVTLDETLAAGPRSGKANLLILIDQFEEVFSLPAGTKDSGLDMVMSLVTSIQTFRPDNLFLIATMRNEWLHRCSEIPGVAEAMNGSTYLIDLVADFEIRNIIVEPARAVLRAADLEPGPSGRGPFAEETLGELLKAFNDVAAVQHESDRLPLLQHLLPLLWAKATERSADRASFSIEPGDLKAVPGWSLERRLAGCLNENAGRVLDDAVAVASKSARIGTGEARQLMQAAFSNLAVLDEQGIVRRRFATIEKMLNSSALVERQPGRRKSIETGLEDGLAKFVAATLINAKKTTDGQSFDINHEALVRNWDTYALWVDQAKSLTTRLRSIDDQIRPAQAKKKGILSSIRRRLNNFFSATDLKEASDKIGTETADEFLSNVFGPHATFSRAWAGDALHDNDNIAREQGGVKDVAPGRDRADEVARIEDRAKDAERFRNNPLNRYRLVLIVVALAGVAISGFALRDNNHRHQATLEREKVLDNVRMTFNLQSIASDTIRLPTNNPKYRNELDRSRIESFAAFMIVLEKNKKDSGLQPEFRKPLTEALFDIEGKWRLDLGGKIWLRPSMTGNTEFSPEDAPCIDPAREKPLRISTDGTVAWAPFAQGNRRFWQPSIQVAGETFRPLDSNLQGRNGEEWQPGSVVCTSPDGRWQLEWMVALNNGTPVAQWPAIRAIEVKTVPKSLTHDASQFVTVGTNRFFVDGDRSTDIYPDLFKMFSDTLSAVRDQTPNRISFVQDGHWVGFQILTSDKKKSFTLWTAAGVGDFQEAAPPDVSDCAKQSGEPSCITTAGVDDFQEAAPRDVSDCVKQLGEPSCIIGPLTYAGDNYNVVVTSDKKIEGNPNCNEKGVVCATSFQLRFADKTREQIVRAEIREFSSTQIRGGMITSNGYLILKDDAGQFWRYLLDDSKLAEIQKNSWNGADLSKINWSSPCKNLHCKVGSVEAK